MRFQMDFSKLPKCGAKPKKGSSRTSPCRHIALQNGRCYYHGGRPIQHGRYSKAAKNERAQNRNLINQAKQVLRALEDHVNEAL